MLSSLQIENVAVIQKAEVHFEPGLNVLTGETGAGKSILIDSINAILGNRTSKDLVRTGAAKAVIRAAFEQVPPTVLDKNSPATSAPKHCCSAVRSPPRARAAAASTECRPRQPFCGSCAVV